MRRSICIILALALPLSACSLPRVIVLHDPLSADEHVQLGAIYDGRKQHDLAVKQYQAAIEKDHKHAAAWNRLADSAYRLGAWDDAEKAYRRVLKLQPSSGEARNNLAWVLLRKDTSIDEALVLAKEAIDLDPGRRPYYLDTLGVVLTRLKQPKEAISALEGSLASLPQDQPELLAEAYDHLADAWLVLQDPRAAQQARDQASRVRNKK